MHGVDAEPDAIAQALEVVPGGDFRLGLMESLPWADASFDVVTWVQRRAVRPRPRAGADRGHARGAHRRADCHLQMGTPCRQRVLRLPRLDRRRGRTSTSASRRPIRSRMRFERRVWSCSRLVTSRLRSRWPTTRRSRRRCRERGSSLLLVAAPAGTSVIAAAAALASGRRHVSVRQPAAILGAAEARMSVAVARGVGPARIDIAYERFGDPGSPPVLLVMGLGTQMLGWPDGFCERARRPRRARDPLRQPRHRPVDPPDRCAAARRPGGAARRHVVGVLPAVGHGRRHRRAARRARAGQRAPRRRLDGRDDRPDRRRSNIRTAFGR